MPLRFAFALSLLVACGPDATPASNGPSVSAQVADELERRHGERFEVRFVGGGVNEGNLFDGPDRTYEAELRPIGGGRVAHAHVRVNAGHVLDIEDDVASVRASEALGERLRERMREPLPELESVCVRVTHETGTTAVAADPTANLRRVTIDAYVGGLSAEAVLAGAHERVREAALVARPLGREPGGLTLHFFGGPVPPLLANTPCTTENTTTLTLHVPMFIVPLASVENADTFADRSTAVGFGRSGSLAEVLAR